jgi:uncharacterized protein with HEPN domain
MSRAYQQYLQDMVESARKVLRYINGLQDFADFKANQQIVDAVLFNLYVIGEAVRNIPDEIKQKYSHVDWRGINIVRNLIAHVYFGLNLERIWTIIQADVPQLITDITGILEDLESQDPPADESSSAE